MKFQRQAAIIDLITNHEIDTQEELTARLREMGFNSTQATISRDIKELRLIKIASSNGGYKYSVAENEQDSGFVPSILPTVIHLGLHPARPLSFLMYQR